MVFPLPIRTDGRSCAVVPEVKIHLRRCSGNRIGASTALLRPLQAQNGILHNKMTIGPTEEMSGIFPWCRCIASPDPISSLHALIYFSPTDITFLSPERRTCDTQPTAATPPTACVSTVHPGDVLPIKGTDPWQRGGEHPNPISPLREPTFFPLVQYNISLSLTARADCQAMHIVRPCSQRAKSWACRGAAG